MLVTAGKSALDAKPPSIQGDGKGNPAMMSAAHTVAIGYHGLPFTAQIELMRHYNLRSNPAWSDAEMERALRNAKPYPEEPLGHMYTPMVLEQLADKGSEAAAIYLRYRREELAQKKGAGDALPYEAVDPPEGQNEAALGVFDPQTHPNAPQTHHKRTNAENDANTLETETYDAEDTQTHQTHQDSGSGVKCSRGFKAKPSGLPSQGDLWSVRPARLVEVEEIDFPIEKLPKTVAHYVLELSLAMGCPVDIPAVFSLTAMAGAIGASRALRMNNSYIVNPIIWSAVAAIPGVTKTPALNEIFKPLHDLDARLQQSAA
jgi:hypothetical protein